LEERGHEAVAEKGGQGVGREEKLPDRDAFSLERVQRQLRVPRATKIDHRSGASQFDR
jgi:hypothetical protein